MPGLKLHHIFFIPLVSLVLTHTSCTTIKRGGAPDVSFAIEEDLKALESKFSAKSSVIEYYKIEAPRPEDRNKFIGGRLVVIDLQYIRFIRSITAEKQLSDSSTEFLTLALGIAGTAASGADAKTILAATSTAVSGTGAIIDKNFFYEQTVPAIVTAMNAERKSVLVRILSGLDQSLAQYPFEMALRDLHDYYSAGTFIGAIHAIQKDADTKAVYNENIIANFTKTSFGDDVNSSLIESYWMPDGSNVNQENENAILDWMKQRDLPDATPTAADIVMLLNSKALSSFRDQLVKDLGLSENQ